MPPTFPTFSAALGVYVDKNDDAQKTQIPTTSTISATSPATPMNPIVIQMPYQYPYSNQPSHLNLSNVSTHPKSPELPSINEFLFNLDQKYKCDNVYSQFENAFSEEEITVNAIKDLSDEQMVKLGIVKIGWQKNIKQAAQRY